MIPQPLDENALSWQEEPDSQTSRWVETNSLASMCRIVNDFGDLHSDADQQALVAKTSRPIFQPQRNIRKDGNENQPR